MPKKKPSKYALMLCDSSNPNPQRQDMLRAVATDEGPRGAAVRDEILSLLERANGEAVHAAKLEELKQLLSDLEEGPFRPAYFIRNLPANGSPRRLAQVLLDDGSNAYTVVVNEEDAKRLQVGERVLLDRQAKALLHCATDELRVGDEARLERRLPEGRLEVALRGEERAVFFASGGLLAKLESGEAGPGDTLVVNTRLSMALDVVPAAEGLAHFRFLVKTPPPDVVAERDMGSPPPVIAETINDFRAELVDPARRRAYGCPRSQFLLFTGPPGTGKTMSIQAISRGICEVVSEHTGIPVDELPRFFFQLRSSLVLDPYVGVAERNIDRFYDEVEERAAQTITTPDGRKVPMPVVAVAEEIDGLAQQRGQQNNGVLDRILTTFLQRLDRDRPELRDRLIIFIGTTNNVQNVDPAFLRRIGGKVVSFGELGRRDFAAILGKHLADRPLVADTNGNGSRPPEPGAAERELVERLTASFYSPNGSDPGVVELSFTGSGAPEIRYKRDFLNPDLISRSVREACNEAVRDEERVGREAGGLGFDRLSAAFDRQIRSVAAQLNEHNVSRYLALPDGVRVAGVRRLPPAPAAPLQLQSA